MIYHNPMAWKRSLAESNSFNCHSDTRCHLKQYMKVGIEIQGGTIAHDLGGHRASRDSKVIKPLPQAHGRVGAVQGVDVQPRGAAEYQALAELGDHFQPKLPHGAIVVAE